KMPAERRQRLDALGFVWDAIEEAWETGFHHLAVYKQREGHCRVPAKYMENGFRLGQWVSVQRQAKGKMPAERRRRLDALGFVWDPYDADWDEGFRYLTIYKEREGHCRVPRGHRENGFGLGQWVADQRKAKGMMPAERRQRLDELEFIWDTREAAW